MTAFHDRADQEAGLAATRTALQNTGAGDNAEGLGDLAAMRADKAVRPTGAPKIGSTCRVIGKQPLKLRERPGKSQIVALVDVHPCHDGQRQPWWVSASSPQYQDTLHRATQYFSAQGFAPSDAQARATAWIGQQVQAQSAYLSYVDVFWVLMLLSLAAVPLAMSLRKVKLGGRAPAAH
jgi:hypothetical protein